MNCAVRRLIALVALLSSANPALACPRDNNSALNAANQAINGASQGRPGLVLGGATREHATLGRHHDTPAVRIERDATAWTDNQDLPGDPGAPHNVGMTTGRYIISDAIRPSDLPYAATIANAPGTIQLPASLSVMPQAPVRRGTNVLLLSNEHSGSSGLVRLGELNNGRPVALRAITSDRRHPIPAAQLQARLLMEARGAKLVSDLGIGPQFHGLHTDASGRVNIVTDVVPGESPQRSRTNSNSFRDLDVILDRLRSAGIEEMHDFQYLQTREGRLQVIDAGSLADQRGVRPRFPSDSINGHFTTERRNLISDAEAPVAIEYLERLRRENPPQWRALVERLRGDLSSNIAAHRDSAARFSGYLNQHQIAPPPPQRPGLSPDP